MEHFKCLPTWKTVCLKGSKGKEGLSEKIKYIISLADTVALKQQFETCTITNLLLYIISQETTHDKFLAQCDSPPSSSSPLQKDLTSNSAFDELLHHCGNAVDLCRNPAALDRTNWKGKKKFWPSVMINKYITGYNSGEWRLTLTEHHDLHTTAKSPPLNKSQLLFVFSPLNDNFLKSKCRMEKEKKPKQ